MPDDDVTLSDVSVDDSNAGYDQGKIMTLIRMMREGRRILTKARDQ